MVYVPTAYREGDTLVKPIGRLWVDPFDLEIRCDLIPESQWTRIPLCCDPCKKLMLCGTEEDPIFIYTRDDLSPALPGQVIQRYEDGEFYYFYEPEAECEGEIVDFTVYGEPLDECPPDSSSSSSSSDSSSDSSSSSSSSQSDDESSSSSSDGQGPPEEDFCCGTISAAPEHGLYGNEYVSTA